AKGPVVEGSVFVVRLIKRVVRRPDKYFQRSFWRVLLNEAQILSRGMVLYSVPALVKRASGVRQLRAYIFPSPMDRFQRADIYVAWKALRLSDVTMSTDNPDDADIALAWHPATSYDQDDLLVRRLHTRMNVLNARCTDIRKSTVDAVFKEIFGYSLAIDPRTHAGPILRKSEKNGAHDAVLLKGPLDEVEPDHVYQRLVSYPTELGNAEFRVFIVAHRPVAVHRTYRPCNDRFRLKPTSGKISTVEADFTPEERALIAAFADRIGLDFGVLDILRDGESGRIYICDCNNTPTGPMAILPIREQRAVLRQVGEALEREYLAPLRARPRRSFGKLAQTNRL
ncbi:MAG: hypothetical protein M3R35_00825, partial [Candidatus Eremiobacteraeota bacterium]|nr:hypothetical protein [Candidatus Eremiobacteraeota bacterium]